MTALNLILAGLLELQHFELGAANLGYDFARNGGLGDVGARDDLLFVSADGDDAVECDFAADFALKALDPNLFARHGAILLTPTANNGVHAASRQS